MVLISPPHLRNFRTQTKLPPFTQKFSNIYNSKSLKRKRNEKSPTQIPDSTAKKKNLKICFSSTITLTVTNTSPLINGSHLSFCFSFPRELGHLRRRWWPRHAAGEGGGAVAAKGGCAAAAHDGEQKSERHLRSGRRRHQKHHRKEAVQPASRQSHCSSLTGITQKKNPCFLYFLNFKKIKDYFC